MKEKIKGLKIEINILLEKLKKLEADLLEKSKLAASLEVERKALQSALKEKENLIKNMQINFFRMNENPVSHISNSKKKILDHNLKIKHPNAEIEASSKNVERFELSLEGAYEHIKRNHTGNVVQISELRKKPEPAKLAMKVGASNFEMFSQKQSAVVRMGRDIPLKNEYIQIFKTNTKNKDKSASKNSPLIQSACHNPNYLPRAFNLTPELKSKLFDIKKLKTNR